MSYYEPSSHIHDLGPRLRYDLSRLDKPWVVVGMVWKWVAISFTYDFARLLYDATAIVYDSSMTGYDYTTIHHDPIRLTTTASRFHYACKRLTTTHDDQKRHTTEHSMPTIHHDLGYKRARQMVKIHSVAFSTIVLKKR